MGQPIEGDPHTGDGAPSTPPDLPTAPVAPGPPPEPTGRPRHERRLLWGAVAAVATVAVLAVGTVMAVAAGGSSTRDAAPMPITSETTLPWATRVPTPRTTGPGATTPPRISIPPLFGGQTTGPGTSAYEVKVQGTGTAQLITLGVPGVSAVGPQQLPWSKSFRTNGVLVSVTVIAYEGTVSCSITKDGRVVAEEAADGTGGGPVICTATR